MTAILILTSLYLLAVLVFHYCAIKRGTIGEAISKGVASLLFVAIGCVAFPISCDAGEIPCTFQVGIIAGLIFGMLGDILLALRNIDKKKRERFILGGIGAFALGHFCYLAVIALNLMFVLPDGTAWMALIPVALGLGFGWLLLKLSPKLHLDFGKLKPGVFFYGALIACMLFSAILTASAAAIQHIASSLYIVPAIASVLFVTSDSLLSKAYFDKSGEISSPPMIIAIHATYYIAQYLFAIAAITSQI